MKVKRNELPVTDDGAPGNNPTAPDAPPSLEDRIAVAESQLVEHRELMKVAKREHEEGLEKARELRKLLANTEQSLANNEYEKLMQTEHNMMAQLRELRNQRTSKTSDGMPTGAR